MTEPQFTGILLYDGACPFCSAASTAMRQPESVGVVPQDDSAAQAFLEAQFGELPFALFVADIEAGTVWAGEGARANCVSGPKLRCSSESSTPTTTRTRWRTTRRRCSTSWRRTGIGRTYRTGEPIRAGPSLGSPIRPLETRRHWTSTEPRIESGWT